MKLLVTHALRRSGQHAIINWLCSQSGNNLHLNNINILSFEGHIRAANYVIYKDGEIIRSHFDRTRMIRWEDDQFPNSRNFDLCVLSFEDMFPQSFDYVYQFLGFPPSEVLTSVILRDPYNLFASRIQTYNGLRKPYRKESMYTTPQMWKSHAFFCLEPFRYETKMIPILFNKWCSDKAYRKELAGKMGLKFTDNGFKDTPLHGKSLFTEDQNSTVLDRWKIHRKRVMKNIDKDTADMSRQLFGEII